MGGKQSTTNTRVRTYSNASQGAGPMTSNGGAAGLDLAVGGPSTSAGAINTRARARSLGSVQNGTGVVPSLSIPNRNGGTHGAGSPDSDASTPEEHAPFARGFMQAQSLPVHLLSFHALMMKLRTGRGIEGIKCPVCSKFVPPDDVEVHLVMCLTKPRISYNEDVLTEDKGECVICLEDLQQGDTIARLPCLCIYHKGCIDDWFQVNRSCPEHPQD